MATQSDPPPNSVNENPLNPATGSQPAAEDHQNSKPGATGGSSPTSVFVNSEPIREDQVQNAIKFLSHPKVRGSPVMYRRSFLERKGLTKEEIDEAFRRVPDPSPTVTSTQPVAANEDGTVKYSPPSQPVAAMQNLQPASATPSNGMTKVGYLSRFRWTHAILAIGLLAASGAGTAVLFKKSIIPRLKSWIRKVVKEEDEKDIVEGRPSLAEEAAVAAKAAAAAAADVARASQEMLASKSEEKRYFEELTSLLNYQVREMKSMTSAIQKLDGQSNSSGRIPVMELDDRRNSVNHSGQSYANGNVNGDARSARSLSPPASVEPSAAPHPKSYMEIMSMIQRGEKPSNIREINDQPPNPNQPVPDARVPTKPKPWEVGQSQNGSTNFPQSQVRDNGLNYGYQDNMMNGDNYSAPWLQRNNARITEIESEGEQMFGSPAAPVEERPVQRSRSWVPPQPPPVAMAEAAAAIRQPKKPAFQVEQLTDDQLMARSSEIPDELQRITKISESGGVPEASGSSSGLQMSETPIEEVDAVLSS